MYDDKPDGNTLRTNVSFKTYLALDLYNGSLYNNVISLARAIEVLKVL